MTPANEDASPDPVDPDRPPSDELLLAVPLQARSRRTLRKMVSSARRLLAEAGDDAITVHGVAKGAGVSVGAFYARFEGRDQFVAYLGERSLEEALESWDETVGEATPDLAAALTALAAAHLDGPLRTVDRLHGHQDPDPSRLRRFEDRVARDLRVFDPFPSPPEPRDLLRALFLAAGVRELAIRALAEPDEDSAVPADAAELAHVAASLVVSRDSLRASEPEPQQQPEPGPDHESEPEPVFTPFEDSPRRSRVGVSLGGPELPTREPDEEPERPPAPPRDEEAHADAEDEDEADLFDPWG